MKRMSIPLFLSMVVWILAASVSNSVPGSTVEPSTALKQYLSAGVWSQYTWIDPDMQARIYELQRSYLDSGGTNAAILEEIESITLAMVKAAAVSFGSAGTGIISSTDNNELAFSYDILDSRGDILRDIGSLTIVISVPMKIPQRDGSVVDHSFRIHLTPELVWEGLNTPLSDMDDYMHLTLIQEKAKEAIPSILSMGELSCRFDVSRGAEEEWNAIIENHNSLVTERNVRTEWFRSRCVGTFSFISKRLQQSPREHVESTLDVRDDGTIRLSERDIRVIDGVLSDKNYSLRGSVSWLSSQRSDLAWDTVGWHVPNGSQANLVVRYTSDDGSLDLFVGFFGNPLRYDYVRYRVLPRSGNANARPAVSKPTLIDRDCCLSRADVGAADVKEGLVMCVIDGRLLAGDGTLAIKATMQVRGSSDDGQSVNRSVENVFGGYYQLSIPPGIYTLSAFDGIGEYAESNPLVLRAGERMHGQDIHFP